MIQRHLPNVMTFFAHRITNAAGEGLNSKIQTIKKMAYGFRNREHFKTAIYFHCGGLDLYPTPTDYPRNTRMNRKHKGRSGRARPRPAILREMGRSGFPCVSLPGHAGPAAA